MRTKSIAAAAALLLSVSAAAMAQTAPTAPNDAGVRDILNRAQTQSDRRAVEDLIGRLRGGTPTAPAQPGVAPPSVPGASPEAQPAQAGAPPAAVAPPPATTAQPAPETIPATVPIGAAAVGGTASPAPETAPAPQTVAVPPAQLPTQPPAQPAIQPVSPGAAQTTTAAPPAQIPAAAAPEPAATTASAPASPPASGRTGQQRQRRQPVATPPAPDGSAANVGAPIGPAEAFPAPITPPGVSDAIMARAPEIARTKGLPTADLEVWFDFDSDQITPRAAQTLTTLGQALRDPQLAGQKFVIAGHTDAKGRPDYNLALSERRSQAVRTYLIQNFQIPADDLIARGFGESQLKNRRNPLASDNRRVQVINFTSEMAGPAPRRR